MISRQYELVANNSVSKSKLKAIVDDGDDIVNSFATPWEQLMVLLFLRLQIQ